MSELYHSTKRHKSEPPHINPDSHGCCYYVSRKHRFCRSERANNSLYCPTHSINTRNTSSSEEFCVRWNSINGDNTNSECNTDAIAHNCSVTYNNKYNHEIELPDESNIQNAKEESVSINSLMESDTCAASVDSSTNKAIKGKLYGTRNTKERVPCPINPHHTVYASRLSKHVKVCPDLRFVTHTLPYYEENKHAFKGIQYCTSVTKENGNLNNDDVNNAIRQEKQEGKQDAIHFKKSENNITENDACNEQMEENNHVVKSKVDLVKKAEITTITESNCCKEEHQSELLQNNRNNNHHQNKKKRRTHRDLTPIALENLIERVVQCYEEDIAPSIWQLNTLQMLCTETEAKADVKEETLITREQLTERRDNANTAHLEISTQNNVSKDINSNDNKNDSISEEFGDNSNNKTTMLNINHTNNRTANMNNEHGNKHIKLTGHQYITENQFNSKSNESDRNNVDCTPTEEIHEEEEEEQEKQISQHQEQCQRSLKHSPQHDALLECVACAIQRYFTTTSNNVNLDKNSKQGNEKNGESLKSLIDYKNEKEANERSKMMIDGFVEMGAGKASLSVALQHKLLLLLQEEKQCKKWKEIKHKEERWSSSLLLEHVLESYVVTHPHLLVIDYDGFRRKADAQVRHSELPLHRLRINIKDLNLLTAINMSYKEHWSTVQNYYNKNKCENTSSSQNRNCKCSTQLMKERSENLLVEEDNCKVPNHDTTITNTTGTNAKTAKSHKSHKNTQFHSERLNYVVTGKHLCGACTDFALSCFTDPELTMVSSSFSSSSSNSSSSLHVNICTAVIATCCHHRCELQHINPPEKDDKTLYCTETCVKNKVQLLSYSDHTLHLPHTSLLLTSDEFAAIASMSSWAVSDTFVNERQRYIGRCCKRVIDAFRVHYLRSCGFDAVQCEYVSSNVTPENVCIVAWNGN